MSPFMRIKSDIIKMMLVSESKLKLKSSGIMLMKLDYCSQGR